MRLFFFCYDTYIYILSFIFSMLCYSLMYFPAEVLSGPELSAVLQRSKASEAAIDEASLQDDELF